MLNIYVNTWRNYNENGADGGEWITLPMDETDLEEKLDAIAESMDDNDPEFFINDYEWTSDDEYYDIDENDNILEVNEYLERIEELDDYERKVFSAAREVFGSYVEVDDIDDFQLFEGIDDEYDLGHWYAVESGCYDLDKMGNLANYIDYEAFGRDISIEADGGFSEYGWIERC